MKKLLVAVCALAAIPMMSFEAAAHGCHRDAQEGRYGWHRHVGRDCERVAVERPHYRERYERRHRDRCEIKCKYIGPFKTCDKVCY
jgi:hypothetical protein